jgi:hypothetical protein
MASCLLHISVLGTNIVLCEVVTAKEKQRDTVNS